MIRRTISLPDRLDEQVLNAAREGESYSDTVARLLDAGLSRERDLPSWIGSGESGDPELAFRVEEILSEAANIDAAV